MVSCHLNLQEDGVRLSSVRCSGTANMCGRWPDINIFRVGLKGRLNATEMVVADKGYRGDSKCRTPSHLVSRTDSRATNKALARHETVNKRLKQFKVLKEQFRHPLYKHKDCFYASAAATQVMTFVSSSVEDL